MEPFVTGLIVTMGVVGGTLVNALFVQKITTTVKVGTNGNGAGTNGNGKVAHVEASLLLKQQLALLTELSTGVREACKEEAAQAASITQRLTEQTQVLTTLTKSIDTHDAHMREAWHDLFVEQRKQN